MKARGGSPEEHSCASFSVDMPLLGNIVTGGLRMSKFISKSARKRIPMTPKMGNKNFYKGTGSTKEGHLTSRGVIYVCLNIYFFPA